MAGSVAPRPRWTRGESYDYLLESERATFAWEWLRRTAAYRQAWIEAQQQGACDRRITACRFGLAVLVPPTTSGAEARPIWLASLQPHVLQARPAPHLSAPNLLDIWRLRRWAEVAIVDDVEYWRLGDARVSIRIDLADGTLLGGPAGLCFHLCGLTAVEPQLATLARLIRLCRSPDARLAPSREPRRRRWIAELRAADALAKGATQREIALALLAPMVSRTGWRDAGDSVRLRVQRLVRGARARLANPLAPLWFRGGVR